MNSANDIQDASLEGLSSAIVSLNPKKDVPALPDMFLRMRTIRESLFLAVKQSRDKKSLLRAIATVIANHASCEVILYFERDQFNQLTPGTCLHGNYETLSDECKNELLANAETACRQGRSGLDPLKTKTNLFVLSVPVSVSSVQSEAFTVVVSHVHRTNQQLLSVAELASASITLWHTQQEANYAKYDAQTTAALQELLEKLEASPDLDTACRTLLDELQQYLECQRVALALRARSGARLHLQAISGAEKFDKHSSLVSAIEAALDESVLRDTLTVWPPLMPGDRHASLAHHKLCSVADSPCVVSSPLQNTEGEVVGAWLFFGERACFEKPNVLNFIRASGSRVASCLSLLQRASEGPIAKLRQSLLPKKFSWKRKSIAIAVCAVIAILCLPIQYKIGADCLLEPVSRRFVAAPYDGILEKALVTSGATVHKGEVLARMDDREIRWELTSVMAERDR
ncbi:MAG: biotin/lipoyl-binding protein, partial [Planctomycetia bacterium]